MIFMDLAVNKLAVIILALREAHIGEIRVLPFPFPSKSIAYFGIMEPSMFSGRGKCRLRRGNVLVIKATRAGFRSSVAGAPRPRLEIGHGAIVGFVAVAGRY